MMNTPRFRSTLDFNLTESYSSSFSDELNEGDLSNGFRCDGRGRVFIVSSTDTRLIGDDEQLEYDNDY
jgi:hypothetical protein